jgi:hypothetical protein
MPLEQFLAEHGTEISESYKMGGAPGTWARDFETALEYLRQQGIQAFDLSSSYGLSGWVLARDFSIFSPQQNVTP